MAALARRLTVVVAANAFVASCSAPADELVMVGTERDVCVEASADGLATVGADRLDNPTSSTDATITDVLLTEADGLEVAGWYLVRAAAGPAAGAGFVKPPRPDYSVDAGKHVKVLVLGLRLTDPHREGRASAAQVVYVAGNHGERRVDGRTVYRVVPRGSAGCADTAG